MAERSQPGLADLRLVADDGREVPYVLDVDVPRTAERRRSGRLVEAPIEPRRMSAWVVDFEDATAFDRLELDIDGADFSKRIHLETSLDGAQWTRVGGEAWVFDRPWRGRRIHDTAIEQAAPLTARYVRLTVDDWRSTPVAVRGVTAVLTTHLGGRRWTREATLVRLDTPAGQPSRYRIDAPAGAPVERIAIATDDVAFWRDVRVFEAGPRGDVAPVSERATIYRVRLDDADLDAERLDVDLVRPIAAPLIVEIEDGDSPPLARAAGDAVRHGAAGAGPGDRRAADALLRQRRDPAAGLRHRGAAHAAVAGRALSAVHARAGDGQPALRAARPDGVPRVARRGRRHVAVGGVAAAAHRRRRRRLHADARAGRSRSTCGRTSATSVSSTANGARCRTCWSRAPRRHAWRSP